MRDLQPEEWIQWKEKRIQQSMKKRITRNTKQTHTYKHSFVHIHTLTRYTQIQNNFQTVRNDMNWFLFVSVFFFPSNDSYVIAISLSIVETLFHCAHTLYIICKHTNTKRKTEKERINLFILDSFAFVNNNHTEYVQ